MNPGQNDKQDSKCDQGAEGDNCKPPQFTQLTPEERAVFISCRRNAMIRGGVAGTGVIGFLYWLKVNGRAPLIMTRIPGLVYGLSFFGAFVVGAGSYQKTCYKRIMALENSALRDFYQQSVAFAVEKQKKGRNVPERIKRYAEKKSDSPHYSKDETRFHPPSVSKQQSMPKQRPQPSIPSPNVKLEEGPSINMRSYTRDKSMLDTSNQQADQPNAFSSDKPNDTVQPFQYEAPQETTRRGRTFDEIREENRRKQYPTSPQSARNTSRPTGERKRRNKYGDEIED